MAGTVASGELTRAVRFASAGAADDDALRRLLRENPMPGAIQVAFEREPDFFRGADLAGGEDETIVAYEHDRLVCVGRCTQRESWVNGQATPVGYLSELRLDAAARRRFAIVRDGYLYFRQHQGDRLHFTSIASGNLRARRLLESGCRGLPAYEYLGELTTLILEVPRRPPSLKLRVDPATDDDIPELLQLLNQHGQRHSLAAVWTAESLRSLARHGLPWERLFVVREGGAAVACGGLWDQRAFRQIVIHGYTGALRLARPLLNAAARLVGRPGLPTPGRPLAQAFCSPLAFAEGSEALLVDFISALLPRAIEAGLQWLSLALPSGDPRLDALQHAFSTRTWPSRLYRVRWLDQPEDAWASPNGPCLPDVALI